MPITPRIVGNMTLQAEKDEIQQLKDIKRIIDAQLGVSKAEMMEAFDDEETIEPASTDP